MFARREPQESVRLRSWVRVGLTCALLRMERLYCCGDDEEEEEEGGPACIPGFAKVMMSVTFGMKMRPLRMSLGRPRLSTSSRLERMFLALEMSTSLAQIRIMSKR